MEFNVNRRGNAAFIISLLCLVGSVVWADDAKTAEAVEETGSGIENPADLSEYSDILKQFDQMPYDVKMEPRPLKPGETPPAPEFIKGYPTCQAVAKRKGQEINALIRASLKKNPTLAKLYGDLAVGFPNDRLVIERSMPLFRTKPPFKSPEEALAARPRFFGGDTPIMATRIEADGSLKDGVSTIKDVVAEDYVLSTTKILIDDPRYHKTCWAKVGNVLTQEVKDKEPFGVFHYFGKQLGEKKGPPKGHKIFSTLDPLLHFYVIDEDSQKINRVNCRNIFPNSSLLSPDGENGRGECRFAVIDEEGITAPKGTMVYNLDVDLTGVYFIGAKDAGLLVKN